MIGAIWVLEDKELIYVYTHTLIEMKKVDKKLMILKLRYSHFLEMFLNNFLNPRDPSEQIILF